MKKMIIITVFEVQPYLELKGFAQAGVEDRFPTRQQELEARMRAGIMDSVRREYRPFAVGTAAVLEHIEKNEDWGFGYHLLGGAPRGCLEDSKIYMAILKG